MSRIIRRFLTKGLPLLVVVGLVVAAAGCAPKAAPPPTPTPKAVATPTPPPVEKVFKVGVLAPYTGPAARTGEEFKNSTIMALEAIDYKIGNYKIELVWIDSQSDPEKATRAYEEAVVKDKIQAGLHNWHSSVAVACMEVAAKHKIPHFFGMGATEVVNEKFASDPEKYGYWTTKGWPIPKKLSVNYVTSLEDAIAAGIWTPEKKTAAIYGEDTDWGRSFGAAIKSQLQEAGWEILAEEYFDIGQTEFYPLLSKFKDLDVKLVAGTSTSPPGISAFIKQAREVGLQAHIIADGLGWVGEWYELTGDASDYVIDQIPGWTTDEAKAFAKKFEEKWGIEPSPSSGGLSYDFTNFFIEICKATIAEYGELTSESLYKFTQEKIWTGEFTYTDGIVMEEYKYTMETRPDPVVGKGYYTFPVLQYHGGVGKVIWPEEWKEADLELPPQ